MIATCDAEIYIICVPTNFHINVSLQTRVDTDSDTSEDITSDDEMDKPQLSVRMTGVGKPRIVAERCRPKS